MFKLKAWGSIKAPKGIVAGTISHLGLLHMIYKQGTYSPLASPTLIFVEN
jgi:hypothetical protein